MTDKINFPKITIEKEIPNETLEQIRQIAPNVLEDGKVNCKKLNEAIGEMLVDPDEPEHFGLNWPGKRQSIKLARTPSKQTLIPVPGDGVDEDKTQNLFIEGENMEVLKLLQKSYSGRIKMIYIDPPYNTGNDFIYKDKFAESEKSFLESTGQIDDEGNDMVANKKSSGRFHTNWLNMIYPRLKLAKELLTDDGVIFASIDDNEVHNLREVMNEIFGEENFVSSVSRVTKKGGNAGDFFAPSVDYVVIYAKDKNEAKNFREELGIDDLERIYDEEDEKGKFYWRNLYESALELSRSINSRFFIEAPDGSKIIPPPNHRWRWVETSYLSTKENGDIKFVETSNSPHIDEKGNTSKWTVFYKLRPKPFVPDNLFVYIENNTNSQGTAALSGLNIEFSFSKPPQLIKKLVKFVSELSSDQASNDIILDFFAGSGTTGHAVMQLNAEDNGNRKYILVQMPEATKEDSEAFKAGYKNIAEICKERIRRAGKKIKEETKAEIDYGFKVFKLQKESNLKDESEMFGMTDQLTLESAEENLSSLRKDWTKEKLLTEILLIEGFPLTSKIEKSSITTNEILIVTSSFEDRPDKLVVCLDPEINRSTIDNLPVGELDNFIFLESSLPKVGGDEIKQILHERFKSRIKVI